MSVLIKGMDIPATGLYFVSVDNTGGRDKIDPNSIACKFILISQDE